MNANRFFYSIAETLSRALPRRACYALADACAHLYHALLFRDRALVEFNLARALGDSDEVRPAVKRLVRAYARYLVDLFYSDRLSEAFIRDKVRFKGLENLRAALERGRGAILISGHVGHWELAGMILAKLGFLMHIIALKHRHPRVEAVFQARRRKSGVGVILTGSSLKECYRVLGRGEVLGLNVDRLYGGTGERVRFFGTDTLFPSGVNRLAAACGSPVLPMFFFMRDNGAFEFEILPPLDTTSGGRPLQDFAKLLERRIRQRPEQWFVFQRFTDKPLWPL